MTKKKNPTDATLRNINALKKKIEIVNKKIKIIIEMLKANELK